MKKKECCGRFWVTQAAEDLKKIFTVWFVSGHNEMYKFEVLQNLCRSVYNFTWNKVLPVLSALLHSDNDWAISHASGHHVLLHLGEENQCFSSNQTFNYCCKVSLSIHISWWTWCQRCPSVCLSCSTEVQGFDPSHLCVPLGKARETYNPRLYYLHVSPIQILDLGIHNALTNKHCLEPTLCSPNSANI